MFKFLLPVLLLLGGGMIMVEAVKDSSDDIAFAQRGEMTKIEPIGDYDSYARYKRGRREPGKLLRERQLVGYSHAAEISFVTRKGDLVTLEKRHLPPGIIEASRGRKPVTIWYLPDEPTKVRWQEGPVYRSWGMPIGMLVLALGLVQVWRLMAERPRRGVRVRAR